MTTIGAEGHLVVKEHKFDSDGYLTNILNAALRTVNPRAQKMAATLEEYLGKDFKMKLNKSGDPVFINADNSKRIRFDAVNPHGDDPRGHIEILESNRWVDYTSSHRIYLRPNIDPSYHL